jgi:cobyric acid synthase
VGFEAYEIHMGDTHLHRAMPPFATLEDGSREGVRFERIIGTYLHGALESPQVIGEVFGFLPASETTREQSFDALARWLEAHAAPAALSALIELV